MITEMVNATATTLTSITMPTETGTVITANVEVAAESMVIDAMLKEKLATSVGSLTTLRRYADQETIAMLRIMEIVGVEIIIMTMRTVTEVVGYITFRNRETPKIRKS